MSMLLHEEIIKALEKAEDAIDQAEHNLQFDFFLITANRTYYAAYYCMIALLFAKNVFPKTHQGAHTKFTELFIKPGVFPKDTSANITELFNNRQEADYDLDANITADEAAELITTARNFLHLTKEYFAKLKSQ